MRVRVSEVGREGWKEKRREVGKIHLMMVIAVTYVMIEASARNCLVAFASFISFNILIATFTPLYSPSHTSESGE